MNIDSIRKIELEITSDCNAACPGCARTQNPDILEIKSFTIDDLVRMFPDERYIKDKEFFLCGVLGDPAVNKDAVKMTRYLTDNGCKLCQWSTNGAYQRAEWWQELGEISKETGLVHVDFCIDGHEKTNHIYRVNTKWSILDRNIQAFSDAGGNGYWIYIVFDHNENEVEKAREHAKKLGFKFATRTGMRNSLESPTTKNYHELDLWKNRYKAVFEGKEEPQDHVKHISKEEKELARQDDADVLQIVLDHHANEIRKRDPNNANAWVAKLGKKNNKEKKVITTTGLKEHTQKEKVKKLNTFIAKEEKTVKEIKEILPTIKCKLIHEGEIFISAKQEMWPCCFLWDSAFKNKENIMEKLSEYQTGWNSLKVQGINEVLSHPWFDKVLGKSWNPGHEKHLPRCIRTCAYHKAYHNEINIDV